MPHTMRHVGIDEAGYGPTLGPLAIVSAAVEGNSPASLLATGVKDSKKLHDSQDLAPLEQVVLPAIAWFTGFQPDTAADCFALLGEGPEVRAAVPWMERASSLRLPVAAKSLVPWHVPDLIPRGLSGSLIQPRAYNAYLRRDQSRFGNKADLEWAHIGQLLAKAHDPALPITTVVDRLGGRKFYRDVLQAIFPQELVLIEGESPLVSRYLVPSVNHAGHAIGFHVGGESVSPLTAIASCIAKYVRELHMLLLNRYWCELMPWLKPTAGYPQDAIRWLHQIGTGHADAWRDDLIRVTKATEFKTKIPLLATKIS